MNVKTFRSLTEEEKAILQRRMAMVDAAQANLNQAQLALRESIALIMATAPEGARLNGETWTMDIEAVPVPTEE